MPPTIKTWSSSNGGTLSSKPNSAGTPWGWTMLYIGRETGPSLRMPPTTAVISSLPTSEPTGHVLASNCSLVHCSVAWGLTARPGGMSTRTSLMLPSGSPEGAVLTSKPVIPSGGWPAACVKNRDSGAEYVHSGVSVLQVPASNVLIPNPACAAGAADSPAARYMSAAMTQVGAVSLMG